MLFTPSSSCGSSVASHRLFAWIAATYALLSLTSGCRLLEFLFIRGTWLAFLCLFVGGNLSLMWNNYGLLIIWPFWRIDKLTFSLSPWCRLISKFGLRLILLCNDWLRFIKARNLDRRRDLPLIWHNLRRDVLGWAWLATRLSDLLHMWVFSVIWLLAWLPLSTATTAFDLFFYYFIFGMPSTWTLLFVICVMPARVLMSFAFWGKRLDCLVFYCWASLDWSLIYNCIKLSMTCYLIYQNINYGIFVLIIKAISHWESASIFTI